MMMDKNLDLTLFLWLEGFFPKQIAYTLLLKGIAGSPAQLYDGKTNDPRLNIKLIKYNGSKLEDVDPEDPKPPGKSVPCLRIIDPARGGTLTWVNESSAIITYLEEMYPESPQLISPTPLSRAVMHDIQAAVYSAFNDCNYYLKNAASVTTKWSGMSDQDRSLSVASHAKSGMVRTLRKMQAWAAESLQQGGWLTPGLETPGIPDLVLAGGVRYFELSYSLHMLADEELGPLRDWYARFKQLPWWDALEESGKHPKELVYPEGCLEV